MQFGRLVAIILVCLIVFATETRADESMYWRTPPDETMLHDGKLHIVMIGTGNPESEMQNIRKPSCTALICNGQFVLIDAGEGAIQNIAGFGLPYHAIDKIFMTHWHSDHFAGIGQVMNESWMHGRKTPLNVYGPFGATKIVTALNTAYEFDSLFRAATVRGLWDPRLATATPVELPLTDSASVVWEKDGLKISSFRVDHTPVVPALGYAIEWRKTKIVISGDTRICAQLERNVKDADVLINEVLSRPLEHEAAELARKQKDFGSEKLIEGVEEYHSDSIELAEMSSRAGVRRLVLTHYVPAIPPDGKILESFTSGMKAKYSGQIFTAADGDHIVVTPGSGNTDLIEYKVYPQIPQPFVRVTNH